MLPANLPCCPNPPYLFVDAVSVTEYQGSHAAAMGFGIGRELRGKGQKEGNMIMCCGDEQEKALILRPLRGSLYATGF